LKAYGADPEAAELFPFSDPGACRLHLGAPEHDRHSSDRLPSATTR
jgi:hypothetical protein